MYHIIQLAFLQCLIGHSAERRVEVGILKRILGICETRPPADGRCWEYSGREVRIDLTRAPELSSPGGALRLEGKSLRDRVLVIHGKDGRYYAYRNRCTHMGRRIDPLDPGHIRCCSVSKSTFDYEGRVVSGPAKGPLIPFKVSSHPGELIISVG